PRSASRLGLGSEPTDHRERDHRCQERGATAAEPGRRGASADACPGQEARRCERSARALPRLAPVAIREPPASARLTRRCTSGRTTRRRGRSWLVARSAQSRRALLHLALENRAQILVAVNLERAQQEQ